MGILPAVVTLTPPPLAPAFNRGDSLSLSLSELSDELLEAEPLDDPLLSPGVDLSVG